MGTVMDLTPETRQAIEGFVRQNLPEWMREAGSAAYAERDIELRERTVRVEEELKSQRDLMRLGFEQMEKRFEAVDKRFEAMDKRFEDLHQGMQRWFTVLTVMLGIIGVVVTVSSVLT